MASVTLTDAVKMMTATPARILNLLDHKGSIEAGMDADIVIFDDDINVEMTMVRGHVVYERDE
jgi:N-acetylglucosamine-6-phosphate deacetylase